MNHQSDPPIKKFDIWLADLPTVPESHVQSGVRPVVIVSNDTANQCSPLISIIPLTSNLARPDIPTHTVIRSRFLAHVSMALCEQMMTIDKSRLKERMGAVEHQHERMAIRHCMQVQLDLD